jgi:3-methyladenine DNA glycosylase AlkD
MKPTVVPDTAPALAWLKRKATKKSLDGMARYAIPSDRAFGVSMKDVQALAKELGRDHALAQALWDTRWYEAQLLAAYVDDPAQVTPAQMNRWCRAFDNWAVCDTLCYALFDRTPHAWARAEAWAGSREEYVQRAAFAMLWSLSVHDKVAPDARFMGGLAWIADGAVDERHYVKKAVNMALRAVGKRNAALHASAIATATRLAASSDDTARWVGRDALSELRSASVLRRVSKKAQSARPKA